MKKITKKSLMMTATVSVCLVTALVYLYANSGTATIPTAELHCKFDLADKDRDGLLSQEEFDGYVAAMNTVQPVRYDSVTSVGSTSDSCGMEGKSGMKQESGGCCGGMSVKTVSLSEKEGDCCSSKAETAKTGTKKEGGCCGGMSVKTVSLSEKEEDCCSSKAETAKTGTKKEGGCCGGKE
ncbi:MAG: EF-hand domain-containing protein [Planctomycetaceae bacterium]|jgi:hypothetical protein|nr:EF-hand domain-containing protein [Planctomycetaceae bacterium]